MENTKAIVGEKFEDLSIAEMMFIQGSGDVNPETYVPPVLTPQSLVPSIVTLTTTTIRTVAICKP